MNEYTVTWTVKVSADSPLDAANHARKIQLTDYVIQPLFHVQETVADRPVFAPFDLDISTGKLAGLDPASCCAYHQTGGRASNSCGGDMSGEHETITLSSGLTITKAQYRALVRVYARGQSSGSFESFLGTVQSYGDYIGLAWAGMFLGIETDGYTHS